MSLKELRQLLSVMLANEESIVVAANEDWEDMGLIVEVADGSCEKSLANDTIYLRFAPDVRITR